MMLSIYHCLLTRKDYAVGTEELNNNWVKKK